MKKYKTLIASNIDWLMEKNRTNANDLGKLLGQQKGVGSLQPTIFRIVNGESLDPKTASIQPIADYFGVTVEQLRTYNFRTKGWPPTPAADGAHSSETAQEIAPRSAAARSLIAAIEDADRNGLGDEAFHVLRETLRLIREGPAQPQPGRADAEDPSH